jgi:hypothetical protein
MKNKNVTKIDKIIASQFKAKLMNNTKWREIFICLAEHKLSFYLVFIENPNAPQNSLHQINLSVIEEKGVGDNGIGPFDYKEIYSLIVPKTVRIPKRNRNEIYGYNEIKQDSENLLKSLNKLGQLPLIETDETIEINGYI